MDARTAESPAKSQTLKWLQRERESGRLYDRAAVLIVLLAPLVLLSRLLIPARYDAVEQFGAMTFELSRMLERDTTKGAHSGLNEAMLTLIRSFADSQGGHKIITVTHFVPVTRSYALSFALAPTVPILLALLTRIPLLELVQKFRSLMHV